MNEDRGRAALGRKVKADRMRIYRTVDKARIKAGISRGAWDNVEHGRPAKDFTLGAIEEALGWPTGRAQEVIDGGGASELETAVTNSTLRPKAIDQILEIVRQDQATSDPEGVKGA